MCCDLLCCALCCVVVCWVCCVVLFCFVLCCCLISLVSWVDFCSFGVCLGSIFGRVGGSLGGLGRLLGRLGGVLEGLGAVLGGLGSPWVVKGHFKANRLRRSMPFGRPKGGQDEAKFRPKTDQNRCQKRSRRKKALEDRLGAVLGRSWVVLGAVLGSKSCSHAGWRSFF